MCFSSTREFAVKLKMWHRSFAVALSSKSHHLLASFTWCQLLVDIGKAGNHWEYFTGRVFLILRVRHQSGSQDRFAQCLLRLDPSRLWSLSFSPSRSMLTGISHRPLSSWHHVNFASEPGLWSPQLRFVHFSKPVIFTQNLEPDQCSMS